MSHSFSIRVIFFFKIHIDCHMLFDSCDVILSVESKNINIEKLWLGLITFNLAHFRDKL